MIENIGYKSYSDMATTIRNNLYKIPHDVDIIVGIPRSGMIAASMISELLGKPLSDVTTFALNKGCIGGGSRFNKYKVNREYKKVLVVDDTVYSGQALSRVKDSFKNITDVEFIYMAIWAEGERGKNIIDLYLEYYACPEPWIFHPSEWNIYHHDAYWMNRILFDLDGVLCIDPPSDRNIKEYEAYLPKAMPYHNVTGKIGGIITYRCECYRDVTEKWLKEQGIQYNKLIMAPFNCIEDRDRSLKSAIWKGEIFKKDTNAVLYIESNDEEAQIINNVSGKPVLSAWKNVLYN